MTAIVTLASLLWPIQQQLPDAAEIPAPLFYQSTGLVLWNENGAAVIDFLQESETGVKYRFRHMRKGNGLITHGEGEVFELYERTAGASGKMKLKDNGSILQIAAGDLAVAWSYGSRGKGWIYYAPERIRMSIVDDKCFETLDLTRFRR